jgi:hypothetical protein
LLALWRVHGHTVPECPAHEIAGKKTNGRPLPEHPSFVRSNVSKAWFHLAGGPHMKRKTAWVVVLSGLLLLGGCWPYWHHGGHHGGGHHRHFNDGHHGGQDYRRY